MSAELVTAAEDGGACTTSLIVAEGTGNDHASVMRLIRDNIADFEEFGIVGFEIRKLDGPGRPENFAVLNEEHATLLLTYMRNSDIVRDFKKRLVRAFYELRNSKPALPSKKELAQWVVEAEERAESAERARLEAERHAKALEAPASAWAHMAESSGDYAVDDAAKVLTRDPNIKIGRDRLFSFMAAEGWVYRNRATNRWKAYQTQVDCGRLVEKLGTPFLHEATGQMRVPDPTIRITPKGLAELHKRLGGGDQLALVAEVST